MRAPSLTTRFLMTLLATCVLPLLVVGWFTLRGVRELIDTQVAATFVPRLAADHAQKIDDRLRQIQQACSVVREIARRALEHPTRDEITAFEEQVELVPDLLDNYLDLLLLADGDGDVVYWQDGQRLDPWTHGRRAASVPQRVADADWFQRVQRDGGPFLLPWGRRVFFGPTPRLPSHDPWSYHFGLAMDVPRRDGAPGVLFALIRWPEVQELLDATREVLVAESGFPSAHVFLVDDAGVVHGHTDRSRYGAPLEPAALRAAVLAAPSGRAHFVDEAGRQHMCGFRRLGNGGATSWTLGLAIPEDELFAATDAFLRVLGVAIVVTIVVLVGWSLAASRAIVRPVRELVAATAQIASGDLGVRVPEHGGPELGELASAFNRMAAELAQGREQLAAAEREKAWAEMARQVAHEIKNPLTPMRTTAQLLLRARRDGDPREGEIAARLANTVQEQTSVLDRIASDFRQFAGAPRHELADVEVDAFLRDVAAAVQALFDGGRIAIDLELGAAGVEARVDRAELQRVFVNLIQNAVQAGAAHVRIESLRRDAPAGGVVVRVADDGPGIPAAARERLFQPYFTTKTSGTGLGLAICRRIVEAFGGSIELEATGAAGTTFRIELP